ncbi:arylsulfatase B-like isoform X2 [Leptopilina heterotoma]|uniref:arylsulfatase B-like isoform X2 n=1 Tax=Leptopilina heterotoma TaxID=63436 RepID=UPI001CA9C876|nr:arylsulfatase B-like isoform X2 [Leptopilina heterotoma]
MEIRGHVSSPNFDEMRGVILWLALVLGSLFSNTISSRIPSSSFSGKIEDCEEKKNKPHIIIILADDLGWNDVGFHGSNQISTPNIDALAYNGIILNNHYVAPLCTPSRASLLTGKYPIHMGLQHLVLFEPEPRGLPLTEKLLPQYLREGGYKTHAIGKWHLGYYHEDYTPTFRGFDTHFGYWNGFQDYYSHIVQSTKEGYRGFDMRRNMTTAWDTAGKYSTDLFTEEAIRLIDQHDQSNPMFMYLAHLAPHTGNQDNPFQAPDEEIAKFSYIQDPERRIYAAMVSKLDQSVGEVIAALRRRAMLDNSIIIFLSDNGAPTMGIHSNRGSNYPLRGIKETPWEGAVRGVAAIWSPLIENPKRVSNHLMHIADWLPTLYSAAGLDPKNLGTIDGHDLWSTLVTEKNNPRSEILINIDEIANYAAIRRGDFKYVIGSTKNGELWYGETGREEEQQIEGCLPTYNPQEILMSKAGVAISGAITSKQIQQMRIVRENESSPSLKSKIQILLQSEIIKLRNDAEVICNVKKEDEVTCNPIEAPCLFNIKEDPCERINLAATRPIILKTLEDALLKYKLSTIPASNVENDKNANPINWNQTWTNWMDDNPIKYDSTKKSAQGQTIIIAIIAVIFGLLIIGMFVLMGLNCAKKSFQETRSFVEYDDQISSGPGSISVQDERRISHYSKDLPNFKAIDSFRDVTKNID